MHSPKISQNCSKSCKITQSARITSLGPLPDSVCLRAILLQFPTFFLSGLIWSDVRLTRVNLRDRLYKVCIGLFGSRMSWDSVVSREVHGFWNWKLKTLRLGDASKLCALVITYSQTWFCGRSTTQRSFSSNMTLWYVCVFYCSYVFTPHSEIVSVAISTKWILKGAFDRYETLIEVWANCVWFLVSSTWLFSLGPSLFCFCRAPPREEEGESVENKFVRPWLADAKLQRCQLGEHFRSIREGHKGLW